MPIYEYACNLCKRVEERWFATQAEIDAYEKTLHPCKPNPGVGATSRKCEGRLSRKISAPSFTIGGFNAKNGYSGKTHGEGTGVD